MGASKEIKSCALKMGMGEDADRGPAMGFWPVPRGQAQEHRFIVSPIESFS